MEKIDLRRRLQLAGKVPSNSYSTRPNWKVISHGLELGRSLEHEPQKTKSLDTHTHPHPNTHPHPHTHTHTHTHTQKEREREGRIIISSYRSTPLKQLATFNRFIRPIQELIQELIQIQIRVLKWPGPEPHTSEVKEEEKLINNKKNAVKNKIMIKISSKKKRGKNYAVTLLSNQTALEFCKQRFHNFKS